MIERLFVGWQRPALPEAARLLQKRYIDGDVWDMHTLLVVVPGARAGRRLRQLLQVAAAVHQTRLEPPEIITPADLPERCYRPPSPLATPTQTQFAWRQAMHALDAADRQLLAPNTALADSPMAYTGIAEEARRLREAATAECLTLEDIARFCRETPGVRADRRWEALARLERLTLNLLAGAGLPDRDAARLAALEANAVSCDREIVLVGTQDLNGLERAILRQLASPVSALIPAPEDEQGNFDDTGCLRTEAWDERPIPISDARLHFVGGPADEANRLTELLAALDGRYAREEITVGIGGDTAGTESLGRRLTALGLPVFSPFGRVLNRTRPAALLSAVRVYLDTPTARNFASLIRHPDLEIWLEERLRETDTAPTFDTRRCPGSLEIAQKAADKALLTLLDEYLAECLPEYFPVPEQTAGRAGKGCPSALDFARHRVLAARDVIERLLQPLRAPARPMSAWTEAIAAVLRAIYGIKEDVWDRQLRRSLAALTGILAEMRQIPTALSPFVSGADTLAFVLTQAGENRLPSDEAETGMEMMGWLELALDDAPVLLLTGLHEGSVPANTGDDPLLPDSLRRRLGLADDRRRQARDGFLLRVMLESREHAQLVVARRGADGDPKMPSRLLFACDGPTAARRAQRFALGAGEAAATRPLFVAGIERRLAPPRPETPTVEINSLRVTAFRDYLACPYRFYLRHVLKLEEQDDSQDEMDARLFGILVHECLDAFAHSTAADLTDVAQIRAFLSEELGRQSRRRFGSEMSRQIQLQLRQARRRLHAFAEWQAQSVRDGWRIQEDLSEEEMEAALIVDERPFLIRGRLDRVDYSDRWGFRIIDYKTGDAGKGPEEKHRARTPGVPTPQWIDLQLPLYRRLLEAQGKPVAPGELGYVLLSADLTPVSMDGKGRRKGGNGFVGLVWDEFEHESAIQCAGEIVRKLRQGVFWPPTDPPPLGLNARDPFSGICLDSCRDRTDWLCVKDGSAP